jgi:hypothetical protein
MKRLFVKQLLLPVMTALLLTFGTVQASNWVSLGKTLDGAQETFIDVSSIRVAGGIRRAWVKVIFPPHTERDIGDNANKWVSDEVIRIAFNCGEETRSWEALAIHFDDGSNHSLPAELYPTSWTPVIPDTVESAAMHFICRWHKQ